MGTLSLCLNEPEKMQKTINHSNFAIFGSFLEFSQPRVIGFISRHTLKNIFLAGGPATKVAGSNPLELVSALLSINLRQRYLSIFQDFVSHRAHVLYKQGSRKTDREEKNQSQTFFLNFFEFT